MRARALLMLSMCLFSIVGHAKELDPRQVPANHQPNSALSVIADISKAPNQKAMLANVAKSAGSVAKSFRAETSSVAVAKLNGITIHIADYPDGTRVLTCLEGSLKGLQEGYFNGVLVLSSRNVKWHSKYFVHTYPNGKITSYPKKQIAEIY
jgi:hypothetical protein